MCLVFVAIQQRTDRPLVILFNRDEDRSRPTKPLGYLEDYPSVLAGHDLLRGGTWAGLNKNGKIALLTFVTEPYDSPEIKRSRGLLVLDFLISSEDLEAPEFLERLDKECESYYGFNLIIGRPEKLYHYSNRSRRVTALEPGLYGISNADLDSPWPKVEKGKKELKRLLSEKDFSRLDYFKLMQNTRLADFLELPMTHRSLMDELEKSAILITAAKNGTRSSSLIEFHSSGQVCFSEMSYRKEDFIAGKPIEKNSSDILSFSFQL